LLSPTAKGGKISKGGVEGSGRWVWANGGKWVCGVKKNDIKQTGRRKSWGEEQDLGKTNGKLRCGFKKNQGQTREKLVQQGFEVGTVGKKGELV